MCTDKQCKSTYLLVSNYITINCLNKLACSINYKYDKFDSHKLDRPSTRHIDIDVPHRVKIFV